MKEIRTNGESSCYFSRAVLLLGKEILFEVKGLWNFTKRECIVSKIRCIIRAGGVSLV